MFKIVAVHSVSESESEMEENLMSLETMEESSNSLIPAKSAKVYEKNYSQFMEWRAKNKIITFSENDLLSYFSDLSKTLKSTTLWKYYSILKSTLSIRHKVDLSKYSKLHSLLKRISKGYKPKKSKTFSTSEIRKFIAEAPDSKYLLAKVLINFIIFLRSF